MYTAIDVYEELSHHSLLDFSYYRDMKTHMHTVIDVYEELSYHFLLGLTPVDPSLGPLIAIYAKYMTLAMNINGVSWIT